MQVAGIHRVGSQIEMIEAGEPRALAGDEVLLEVRAAGVGNWDEFVRTGGWDAGAKPPMASISAILPDISRTECTNFFTNAGYGRM